MTEIEESPPPGVPPAAPWWRYPMVWFTLAGPLLVLVAGTATIAIAFARPDPPIDVTTTATSAVDRAAPTAPALQARNHAATPPQRQRP